ncbi:general stress protein [Ammoniphilus oxalaticus]|uniref:General stress protein n=1 Tax=Ammoniphilus oxalaticus TaxID=66863 RepID=A0A419SM45_9BACL|nr:bacillithiol system redox-active protein YtxJ [Ammoniphilus oxalaticus]RKD25044.1 general stress protein [Ammoniphilus oxalaticus]
MNWKELTDLEQWNEALGASNQQPLFVFKHSTTCPISSEALQQFEKYLKEEPRSDVNYVFVKVIETRPVSNRITDDTQVKHESPQAILIENKQAVWHASHWKITSKAIHEAMQTDES